MKKVFLVGILALVVVGGVLAAGCTYDDDESMAQLAMGNLGAFSLGSGAMVTEEQLADLSETLPAMIVEANHASGALMADADILVMKENILTELEKASRASGYMMGENQLVDLAGKVAWIDIALREANHASGTMMTDGQLEALGTAIEAKLGETSPASGTVWYNDIEYYVPASEESVWHPIGAFIVS